MTKHFKFQRYLLLIVGSVSGLGFVVAMPSAASAADTAAAPASTFSMSVEGGYSSWNPLDLWWATQDEAIAGSVCDPTEPVGSYCEHNYVNPKDPLYLNGWSGAAEFDWRPQGMGLDFLVRGRYDVTNTRHIAETWGFNGGLLPDGGTADYNENHFGLDFEVGHDFGIGSMDLRLFGGARFARFKGNSSFATYQYETTPPSPPIGFINSQNAVGNIDRTFMGIGPRIGLNGSLPFGEGGIGLDFAGSGALLFGDRATTINYSTYELSNPKPDSSTQFVVVPNFEASAALFFKPTDNTKVSIGYRYDTYLGVMDTGLPGVENGPNKQDRTIQGPFAKLTFDF